MEKARCNTELYSNLRAPLNNVKPSNFWGSHHFDISRPLFLYMVDGNKYNIKIAIPLNNKRIAIDCIERETSI